ncbi:hypothetical protein NL676_003050 [Syzygium grande]|nr:hypothetical protein NL676_003050 [Syzygium grande]
MRKDLSADLGVAKAPYPGIFGSTYYLGRSITEALKTKSTLGVLEQEAFKGGKASWACRSILEGRSLLKEGDLRQVANGESISVWSDKWISDTWNFQLHPKTDEEADGDMKRQQGKIYTKEGLSNLQTAFSLGRQNQWNICYFAVNGGDQSCIVGVQERSKAVKSTPDEGQCEEGRSKPGHENKFVMVCLYKRHIRPLLELLVMIAMEILLGVGESSCLLSLLKRLTFMMFGMVYY